MGAITEAMEEDEEVYEETSGTGPSYLIHNSSGDQADWDMLNFSEPALRNDCMPDYTADRLEESSGGSEIERWEVRDVGGTEEVEIENDHSTKDDLADRLHSAYSGLE
jgi:hypothetical protein